MAEDTKPNDGEQSSPETEEKASTKSLMWQATKYTGLLISSERAAHLATVLQLVVVIISLVLIRNQLEQQAQSIEQQAQSIKQQASAMEQQVTLTKAANGQALVNLVSPMNLELAKSDELSGLLLRGDNGFKKEVTRQDIERDRYKTLLASYLTFYENTYVQHQKKLLDEELYAGWTKDLEDFVEIHSLDEYWNDKWEEKYQGGFGAYVTKLVEAKKARKSKPAS